jgi:hypothetical protein
MASLRRDVRAGISPSVSKNAVANGSNQKDASSVLDEAAILSTPSRRISLFNLPRVFINLNPEYTQSGVGLAQGVDEVWFVTQIFIAPLGRISQFR